MSASPRSAPLGIWLASLYELRHASDREATLRMAGEHDLNDELLKAEKESVDDEMSVRGFEQTRRETGRIRFAVFYVNLGPLIGVEVSGPLHFEREAYEIFTAYAGSVRKSRDRWIPNRPSKRHGRRKAQACITQKADVSNAYDLGKRTTIEMRSRTSERPTVDRSSAGPTTFSMC